MALRIVHYNEPVLRKKGEKITAFGPELQAFAADMIDAMHEVHGIGLAAQQVGRAIQLCVIDLREAEADFTFELDGARPPLELIMPLIVVNPKLTITPEVPKVSSEEGCLSFPDIRGDVSRVESVTARYVDDKGIPHRLVCDGLFARCLQHEVDHLNGVLFIDRMDKKVRAELDATVKALARQTQTAPSSTSS